MANPPPAAGPSAQTPPPNSPLPTHAAFPSAAELGLAGGSSQSQQPQQPLQPQQDSVKLPSTAEELHALMMTTIHPWDMQEELIPVLMTLTKLRNERGGPDLLALDGIELDTSNDALAALPLAYSCIITARLLAKLNSGSNATDEDAAIALRLIEVGDMRQLAMCLPLVSEFAWALLRSAKHVNRTADSLEPLHRLLRGTSAMSPRKFNGVHAAFLEACLITRHVEPAYETLTSPYLTVTRDTSYLDVLTYHHHAGLVAAANRDYALATRMFTFAASAPTAVASAIQLACVKRAILCELLSTGKRLRMPKDTSSAVNHMLEKTIKAYKDLAKAFESREWGDVQRIVQSKKSTFTAEANYGLVQLILESIPKRRILILRPTYSRIALSDLARKVGLGDAAGEAAVKRMVTSGEIRASVSGSPEIVTFAEDDDYDSPAAMQRLQHAQTVASGLLAELTRADQNLGLHPKWLQKQVRSIDAKEKQNEPAGKRAEGGGSELRAGGAVGSNQADLGF